MSSDKNFLIFSGYNFRAVLAFLRFATSKGVCCYVIARNQNDPIYSTSYRTWVIYERQDDDLNLNLFEHIRAIAQNYSKEQNIILPSTEALNRFLIENKVELLQLGFEVPLVNKDIYELVSDKESFEQLCRRRNLKVPSQVECKAANIPFVAKPKKYFSHNSKVSTAPYIITNLLHLERFLMEENPKDFFFQEFIDGESLYLLYYISKNGSVTAFGQRNLIQQAGGKSIIAAIHSYIYQNNISKDFIDLFKAIGFNGLVMVEIRSRENQHYMIEANPRLWGPSQFFLDSGSSIFADFVLDYGFTIKGSDDEKIDVNRKYFWNGGFVKSKVDFHKFKEHDYLVDYQNFLRNDIYLRLDSLELYYKEITE